MQLYSNFLVKFTNFHPTHEEYNDLLLFLKNNENLYNFNYSNYEELLSIAINIDILFSKNIRLFNKYKLAYIENQIIIKLLNKISIFDFDIFDLKNISNIKLSKYKEKELINFYLYFEKFDFINELKKYKKSNNENEMYSKFFSTINKINKYFF